MVWVAMIAVAARPHHGKRIAAAGDFDRQVLDRLFDRLGVVHIAGARSEPAVKRFRVHHRDVRLNIDLAEPVARALVDGEGDDEALLLRIVDRHRRDHAHVGIAVLEIEAADQIAVGFDAVGIVDVGRLEECEEPEPRRFRRLDLVLQPLVAIGFVADEIDLLDAGLLAFLDLEHEIDAVVRKLDDLRLDADVEAAVAPVDFDDALHVGLHGRTGQRAAGLRLHFVGELVVLELACCPRTRPG